MATLYLIEQNTILRRQGDRLLLCSRPPASRRYSAVLQSDIVLDIPCEDVEHVMMFGNVQVTTSALSKMLEKGVEFALFSFYGELLGQLTPPLGKNIEMRFRQFQCYQDEGFVLDFSRRLVQAKIQNGLNFLRHFHKNHPELFETEEINWLTAMAAKAETVENLDSVRGIEGAAAAHYFKLYAKLFNAPWKFSGRTKRPPLDPVNAVLSFGYVVAGAQIQSLMDGIGLDPYLGFFHQMDYGRPSLALDVLEEFRHCLIDRMTTNLFNLRIMKETDFFKHASGGIYLNTDGKRKFFQQYQAMLGEIKNYDEPVSEQTGYMGIFQKQIQNLAKALKENERYEPFQFSF